MLADREKLVEESTAAQAEPTAASAGKAEYLQLVREVAALGFVASRCS